MEEEEAGVRRRANVLAGAASINSVSIGVALGVVTGLSPLLKEHFGLTDVELELFQASNPFFAMFGAAISSQALDPFGRRAAFVASSGLFAAGAVVESCAASFAAYMVGAAIIGLATGLALAIDPIYIAEIAPAGVRGYYVTWSEIGICVGNLAAYLVSWIVTTTVPYAARWRVLSLAAAASPVALLVAVALVLPESPRWLVVNDRADEALAVMTRDLALAPTEARDLVDDIRHDFSLEAADKLRADRGATWLALLATPDKAIRLMVAVGAGAALAQQLSGIQAILVEYEFAVEALGVTASAVSTAFLVGLGFAKLAGALLAAALLDRLGRKSLLLTSATGCSLGLATLGLVVGAASLAATSRRALFFAALYAYVFLFEIGLGPCCWLVPSEVFYNKDRMRAMGLATTTNLAASTLITGTAYLLQSSLGWPAFFFVFASTAALAALGIALYLPDATGKSLEDVYDFFQELTLDDGGGGDDFRALPSVAGWWWWPGPDHAALAAPLTSDTGAAAAGTRRRPRYGAAAPAA